MTLQQVNPTDVVEQEWVELFAYKTISTNTQSVSFVKRLTAATFSSILYVRGVFPGDSFDDYQLEGKSVKVLNKNLHNKIGHLMAKYMWAAMSAIELQYMKDFILEMSLDDKTIEYYKLEYTYDNDHANMSLSHGANSQEIKEEFKALKSRTSQMIHAIVTFTENLEPLPENISLHLRVNYYDHVPIEFCPKYFSDTEVKEYSELERIAHPVGWTKTHHHSVHLSAASAVGMLRYLSPPQDSADLIPSTSSIEYFDIQTNSLNLQTNTISSNDPLSISYNEKRGEKRRHPEEGERQILPRRRNLSFDSTMPEQQTSEDNLIIDETLKSTNEAESPSINSGLKLNCLCEHEFGNINVFQCNHCSAYHHLVCYGIKMEAVLEGDQCCYNCYHSLQIDPCTDQTYHDKSPRSAKSLAMRRQILMYLSESDTRVSSSQISRDLVVRRDQLRPFLEQLAELKCLKHHEKLGQVDVRKRKINDLLNSEFQQLD